MTNPIAFSKLFNIEFSEDPTTRRWAIEEFNVMMRCTLTQMREAWGISNVRFIGWCERIEAACRSAKEKLNEDEYADFSSLLLTNDGKCRARYRNI